MPWGSSTLAAACSSTWRNLRMVCEEDCRTAVLGKTERTVGWAGDGDPTMRGLVRHCLGKLAATDRPCLRSLSHSFTLDFLVGFQHKDDVEQFLSNLAGPLLQVLSRTAP